MENKNNEENKRKVSFAPKEAITYTYQEHNTTTTNTSYNDSYVTMDITADYSRYGNNDLFAELSTETVGLADIVKEGMSSNSDLKDNKEGNDPIERKSRVEENIVGNTNVEDDMDTTMGGSVEKNNETTNLDSSVLSSIVTEQVEGDRSCNNQNLLSMKLDELVTGEVNFLVKTGEQIQKPTLNEEPEDKVATDGEQENGSEKMNTIEKENAYNGARKIDDVTKQHDAEDTFCNDNRISVSEDRHTPLCQVKKPRSSVKRKSVDVSFNNSLLSDNTVFYEEICNTQDLRKIIKVKPKTNISEFLMNYGIKFFDSIILNSARRSTFSKPISCNDPATNLFLEYCKSKQVCFYIKYSENLERKIAELGDMNKQIERDFENIEVEETHKLKSLKEECRIRSKNAGIEFRKAQVMDFNLEVLSSKAELQERVASITGEVSRLENRLSNLRNSAKVKEEKIETIKARIANHSTKLEPEYIKTLISDQEKLIKSLNEELLSVKFKVENKEATLKNIREEIELVRNDNMRLEQNLKSKNVTENELIELRKEFKVFCSIVDVSISELNEGSFKFELLGYKFDLRLCNFVVAQSEINFIKESPIYVYGLDIFSLKTLPLKNAVCEIITVCNRISYLYKQLHYLASMYSAKVSYSEKTVIVVAKLMDVTNCNTTNVKFTIQENFVCRVGNIEKDLNEECDFMLNYLHGLVLK